MHNLRNKKLTLKEIQGYLRLELSIRFEMVCSLQRARWGETHTSGSKGGEQLIRAL